MRHSILDLVATLNYGVKSNAVSSTVRYTKSGFNFLLTLYRHGFIRSMQTFYKSNKPRILVFFKYIHSQPLLYGLQTGSRPSRRLFFKFLDFHKSHSIHSIMILNTSVGFITNSEALLLGLGGEIVCFLYF